MVVMDLLASALRLSLPLIFAAYGGLLSERSGVANIALEGHLLIAAFAGAIAAHITGSAYIGVAAAMLASGVFGLGFAVACVYGRGDQIVIGTAFNLLAIGALPSILKSLYDVSGSTPPLAADERFSSPVPFAVAAVALAVGFAFLFAKTRHGARVIAAGENPLALATQGVSFRAVRVRAVVEGALVTGIGGAYLALCQGSGYVREMSGGRGFIALAALIFGAWRPIPTLLGCFLFGFLDAIQIQLQGQKWNGHTIPNQFVQIVPYAAALLALVVFARRMSPPAAINRDVSIR